MLRCSTDSRPTLDRMNLVLPRCVRFLLPLAAFSCSGDPGLADPVACTEEFRSWNVVVVDTAGTPIDGLTVQVVRKSTGELLSYGDPSFSAGSYQIMDDGMAASIRIDGETIEAGTSGGAATFESVWEFGADAWRCHVERLSGPDTVVASHTSSGDRTTVTPSFRSSR